MSALPRILGMAIPPQKSASTYGEASIRVLKGLEPVTWKRAAYYPQIGQSKEQAIQAEAMAVRKAAGIIDGRSEERRVGKEC